MFISDSSIRFFNYIILTAEIILKMLRKTFMQISPALRGIVQRVKTAEKRMVTSKAPFITTSDGWTSFYTQGNRKPGYAATPPSLFLMHMNQLKREVPSLISPQAHFADLGSGLGMTCFTAATLFGQVTGFEIDARLCAAAEQIASDSKISNVQFLNRDFIREALSLYDILYFYYPFHEGFDEIMGEKLAELKPGTLIISRRKRLSRLFNSGMFNRVFPPLNQFSIDCFFTEFFTYLRT